MHAFFVVDPHSLETEMPMDQFAIARENLVEHRPLGAPCAELWAWSVLDDNRAKHWIEMLPDIRDGGPGTWPG